MTSSMSGWARLWAAVAAVLTVLLGVAVAQASRGGAASDDGAVDAAAASAGTTAAIDVTLTEFAIEPASLTAAAGQPLTFTISNEGTVPHDFSIEGVAQTEQIPAGESTTLEVEPLEAGEYKVLCTVAGHEPAGMSGTLTVTEEAGAVPVSDQDSSGGDSGDHSDHSSLTPEQMAQLHDEGVAAFPAETEGQGNQPLEPEIEPDGTKVFTLVADEIEWEVEPGVVKEGMAYNGMIPGPRIDVTVGDRIRIDLVNKLEVPTSLHSHGMILPNAMDGVPGLTQPAVMPGETFSYEFTVRNSGSHMYHSHFDSANQVPAGLLGALISHEPDEEDDVDADHVMILNDGPLGYTINGKGFPATQPIVVKRGQRVRIRYMNEGLQIHPMHLHGIPQLVVAKDGYPLPQPRTEDTVLVAPGERVDVIVDATEPGPWAFHCHILNHAEGPDGMFGMVTALIVEE